MDSVIAGKLVDRRLIKGFLLAGLIVAEILFGSLIALKSEDSYLILGAAIGLITIVAAFMEPVLGFYVFVITVFIEASLLLGSVSAARLVGILVLGTWVAHSLTHRRFEIVVPRQGWFAVLFLVWGLVSVLWAMDTQKLFAALLLLVQSMALYILTINLMTSLPRVQVTLTIIIIVSVVLAMLTILRVREGQLVEGRVDVGQISVGGMNAQAAYFLPSAALLMVMLSHKAPLVRKMFFLLGLAVVVLAILAASSRGAMVALAAIVLVGLTIDHKLWRAILPILLVGGAAVTLLPHTFQERLVSIATVSDRGAGRMDIWSVAWRIIHANPIFGVGLDNFGRAFDRYVAETPGILSDIGRGTGSHNIFLNVQSELGIIGFVPFAAFLVMSVQSGLVALMNLRRAGNVHATALATAMWLSLVGILVMGLFIDLQYWKLFWLLLALPEAMRRLSLKKAFS